MDQAQFRELLSTPRAGGSSSAAAGRKFGQVLKRGAAPKEEFKKPDFKPRPKVLKSKKPSDSESEGGGGGSEYRDRAAERREGVEGDFAGVEKLLEDFKARSESSEDRAAVEEQMKYLGGDAEHSVLVKGLDMALLARIKSQQTTESESTLEELEAELDDALRSAVVEKKKKRTRDEMVADLKARVSGGSTAAVVVGEDAPMKGFKPIGKQSKVKGKGKEVLPGGMVEGEKKRRRKKVKQPEDVLPAPPPTLMVPAPISAPIAIDDDKDEFDDIFGDAGEYKGLDTDSSDSDSSPPKLPLPTSAPPPPPSTKTKTKYFSDDSEDEGPITTAPSSVTQLAKSASATAPEEEEEEGVGIGMRLEGLSGSSDVRTMLDMDKEAEKKEMKALRKGKGVEGGKKKEKVRTEEEQSNHEYQVMMNHLEKKEKHKEGGSTAKQ